MVSEDRFKALEDCIAAINKTLANMRGVPTVRATHGAALDLNANFDVNKNNLLVAATRSRVAKAEAAIAAIEKRMTDAETTVATLNAMTALAAADIADVKQSVDSVRVDVASLSERIDAMETSIGGGNDGGE